MQLGATLANNNKSEQAIQVYARALNARPTYARGWLNLGEMCWNVRIVVRVVQRSAVESNVVQYSVVQYRR